MRAVNGHSLRMDQSKIATPLTPQHVNLLSAITHKTQARHIPNIIKYGLRPVGLPPPGVAIDSCTPRGTGDCATINLCAFLPTDPRNVVVG
eukprot:1629340-Heterocapsa_arctica.AAC.1